MKLSSLQSRNRKSRRFSKSAKGTRRAARGMMLEQMEQRVLLSGGTGNLFITTLHDADMSGTKSAADLALKGWTVFVDDNHNGLLDGAEKSSTTNKDGEANINGISTGSGNSIMVDVVEILPSGWTTSVGTPVQHVQVIKNETTDVVFLNTPGTPYGSVTGTVWNDINGDGVRDAGDAGIAGWTVFADLDTNRVLDAGEPFAVTDASGVYTIDGLETGQYKIREITPTGWDPTLGFDGANTVDVTAGSTSTSDFGNFSIASVGSITGTIWNDVNADGARGGGDAGLSGWTVFLDTNLNGVLNAGEATAITDTAGVYSFSSIPVGTYTVREVLQSGWNLSPGHPISSSVLVTSENVAHADFANYTLVPGSISGSIWNDLNADGIMGAEPKLSGWTVFIDQDGDGLLTAGEPTATTDASGNYSLSNVPMGSQVVREVPQVGWSPTAPGTGMQLVVVQNASNISGINFGNKQRTDGAISGMAYFDANHNGTRDAGERGLAGITVYLDANNNGALDAGESSIVTSSDLFYTPAVDETGTYTFTHLPPGTFHVREILPAVLSATPAAAANLTIDLLGGEDRRNVNFADQFRSNEIHGMVFDDLNSNGARDAGEAGLGGVTIYLDVNRDNLYQTSEPKTVTASDGSYAFVTDLTPGSYVLRELRHSGREHSYPGTTGGILWPSGVSHPAIGNVSPTSITTSLSKGQTEHHNVSLTLPGSGALTNMVDVFLLFDDTGSFTANSPIVRAAFPQIISALQTSMPTVDFGFGVGRFEEYANFAGEFATGRPFILNQPIVAASTPGFATSIQSALDRTAPGYGGDQPETDIEALYQVATGRGFDGNNNGNTSDSGAAGLVSTQLTPGASGDVPAFSSFTVDASGNVLPAAGTVGGAGFRAGALPIILVATDTGFAFQPMGETTVTGLNGLTLPISALTQTSRPTTPFNYGAGIQQTVTALNALGALVIGLGTNGEAGLDPRQGLESLAKLTGATNRTLTTIANGTLDPIAPGDPFYFQISSGFSASVANGVVAAIENAATNVAVNIAIKSSDPSVSILSTPDVASNIGAGQTATFDVTLTGDGKPHLFDLQFVRQGTDVVLGSIPVTIGTPIVGDGYNYQELEDGEIAHLDDFGSWVNPLLPVNSAPDFSSGADQSTLDDSGHHSIAGWAGGMTTGSPAESDQLLEFEVSNDKPGLFSVQPSIAPDGTLAYTPAPGAVGTATVTVRLRDSGGTVGGGVDASAVKTFTINVTPHFPLGVASHFDWTSKEAVVIDFSADVSAALAPALHLMNMTTATWAATPAVQWDAALNRATIVLDSGTLPNGDYRLTIDAGTLPSLATGQQFDFFVLAGDVNHDRAVNFNDLVALAQNYDSATATHAQGDLNGDGAVDFSDLVLLAQNYDVTLPGGTAPAPAPVTAAAIAALPPAVAAFAAALVPVPAPVVPPKKVTPASSGKTVKVSAPKAKPVAPPKPVSKPVKQAAPITHAAPKISLFSTTRVKRKEAVWA